MSVRALETSLASDLRQELSGVGADPASWPVFAAKARALAFSVRGLSTAGANILKQVALVSGGDCAVHRDVASGRARRSDAVLFCTPRQLDAVIERLKVQPECAARFGPELARIRDRLAGPARVIRLGRRTIDLGRRTHVMGILNVTPDSFSDGGRFLSPAAAVEHGRAMAGAGADFIDVGAESTRPGSEPVPAREQVARLEPVLEGLRRHVRVPISVDTTSARVAEAALDLGADMVNDVSAFRFDRRMARLVARRGVPCVLMHMQGRPRTMQRRPAYADLMDEVHGFLADALERGERAGVCRSQMIVDPGIGFGKTREQNLELVRRLAELRSLGTAVLCGPSRKRFIGETLGLGVAERQEGTLAACVMAARGGADIVRVHDVAPAVRALRMADAIAGGR
jgi:dihydropteroate synthase